MCRLEPGKPGLCSSHPFLPLLADEPTSPSIDLQAKHVPASAVVSSAMNSAPVLGTSPSSPTFTFALSRHYSQDCSECLWPVSPPPLLSGPVGLLPSVSLLLLGPRGRATPDQKGGLLGYLPTCSLLTLRPPWASFQAASRPAAAPPTCWPSPQSAPSPVMMD